MKATQFTLAEQIELLKGFIPPDYQQDYDLVIADTRSETLKEVRQLADAHIVDADQGPMVDIDFIDDLDKLLKEL